MSRREWKPGDVALVETVNSCGVAVIRDHADDKSPVFVFGVDPFFKTVAVDNEALIKSARPLVVIDPEDREQVDRLARAIVKDANLMAGWTSEIDITSSTARALRSLIADPKPEEPTGLGAVVEDSEGIRWVRRGCPTNKPWAHETMPGLQPWSDLEVVRVLSEGVTA